MQTKQQQTVNTSDVLQTKGSSFWQNVMTCGVDETDSF